MALIVPRAEKCLCRAVGMLPGLRSRSSSVLGLTPRRGTLCKSKGGTPAPLCDSAALCSLPPGWGGPDTASSLLLCMKVMQKSQTALCLAWLQGTAFFCCCLERKFWSTYCFIFCHLWHLFGEICKGLSSLWRLTWAEAQKWELLSHSKKGLHFLHH